MFPISNDGCLSNSFCGPLTPTASLQASSVYPTRIQRQEQVETVTFLFLRLAKRRKTQTQMCRLALGGADVYFAPRVTKYKPCCRSPMAGAHVRGWSPSSLFTLQQHVSAGHRGLLTSPSSCTPADPREYQRVSWSPIATSLLALRGWPSGYLTCGRLVCITQKKKVQHFFLHVDSLSHN